MFHLIDVFFLVWILLFVIYIIHYMFLRMEQEMRIKLYLNNILTRSKGVSVLMRLVDEQKKKNKKK